MRDRDAPRTRAPHGRPTRPRRTPRRAASAALGEGRGRLVLGSAGRSCVSPLLPLLCLQYRLRACFVHASCRAGSPRRGRRRAAAGAAGRAPTVRGDRASAQLISRGALPCSRAIPRVETGCTVGGRVGGRAEGALRRSRRQTRRRAEASRSGAPARGGGGEASGHTRARVLQRLSHCPAGQSLSADRAAARTDLAPSEHQEAPRLHLARRARARAPSGDRVQRRAEHIGQAPRHHPCRGTRRVRLVRGEGRGVST